MELLSVMQDMAIEIRSLGPGNGNIWRRIMSLRRVRDRAAKDVAKNLKGRSAKSCCDWLLGENWFRTESQPSNIVNVVIDSAFE